MCDNRVFSVFKCSPCFLKPSFLRIKKNGFLHVFAIILRRKKNVLRMFSISVLVCSLCILISSLHCKGKFFAL